MSVTILGGQLKGMRLKVIEHQQLRPTSVLLRRKIFDARQSLDEYSFIDLFAGSGAVGIEALSRGSIRVYSIEKSALFFKSLQKNIRQARERLCADGLDRIDLRNQDACSFLQSWRQDYQSWPVYQQRKTIVYVDPPYENHQLYRSVFDNLKVASWFAGEVWVESDEKKGILSQELASLSLNPSRLYQHGSHFVLMFSAL